jgi:hypothetical protein
MEHEEERLPTYGLLAINHAYNEGKITFKEWLELSRQWAQQILEQYGGETAQTETGASDPLPACDNIGLM